MFGIGPCNSRPILLPHFFRLGLQPSPISAAFHAFTTRLHLLQRTAAKWLSVQCPASAAGNAAILDEYVRTVDGTPLAFLRIEGPDSFQVVFRLVHTYPPLLS